MGAKAVPLLHTRTHYGMTPSLRGMRAVEEQRVRVVLSPAIGLTATKEPPMPLRDWIDRYPGVKRLLEQPEDVLEGVVRGAARNAPPCLHAGLLCGRDDSCGRAGAYGRRVCCALVPRHDTPRDRAHPGRAW